MANTLYNNARKLFVTKGIDWENDTFKCLLVDTGSYTPNFDTHQYLSDLGSTARDFGSSGVAGVLMENTVVDANGAVDADDVRFVAVSGATIEAICVYMDVGGVEANSPLIYWADTATGLPITPNGGDIIITWNNGTNKIFRV